MDPAVHLHLKEKQHSFEADNVHVLDKEDRWFEKGVKEPIYIKLKQTSLNRRGGLRCRFSATYNTLLKSLRRELHHCSHIGSWDYDTHDDPGKWRLNWWVGLSGTHRLGAGHYTLCLQPWMRRILHKVKNLELQKSPGWVAKCLQGTTWDPVAWWNTKTTMTWRLTHTQTHSILIKI